MLAAVGIEFIDGHPVDSRCSAVSHHTPVCFEHVLASQHLLDEHLRLVPGLLLVCRACLTLEAHAVDGSAAFGRGAHGHLSPTCRVSFTHQTFGSGSSLRVRPVRRAATRLLWPLLTSARLALALRLHLPLRAGVQTSEGKARDFRPIHPSHLRPPVRVTSGFGWPRPLAHRPDASYAHRVPRAGILPAASSRRFLAVAPLLFG